MTDVEQIGPARGPPQIRTISKLEARLAEPPTLETDVMDFLLITGIGYVRGPIFEACTSNLQEVLRERYFKRRDGMDRGTRAQERLLETALRQPYYDERFKTLYDLKRIIERRGTVFWHFGTGGLATLNSTLGQYHLGPFVPIPRSQQRRIYSSP